MPAVRRRLPPSLLLALAAAGLGLLPATAGAASKPVYVTVAARECPTYSAIRANRARNNIQESLRDLGKDTPYAAGQAIDPDIERASQPLCRPISDWKFTLGRGYKSRAVSGPWGSLSIVTSPFAHDITTQDSVPLLDSNSNPTGRTIDGAVTFALTAEEANLATQANRLWIQGGTTTDPILNIPFPGQYGFGALRCAIDNLNGDNVEWISYPNGATHVFCFAYYVKPPPTSGTIIVRKEVKAPAGTDETFAFNGNISFNPGGDFSLAVRNSQPAEATFYRAEVPAGGTPWSFREIVPPNYRLADLRCTSATQDSTTTTNLASAAASVRLAAGDTVRCTYVNAFVPPPGGLSLRKVTKGGIGTFRFAVDPLEGNAATEHAVATTTDEDVAFAARPERLDLPAGRYRITEDVPETSGGTWRLASVECDGTAAAPRSGGLSVDVTIASGAGKACTFTNVFTPKGRIILRKVTTGALGTAGFVITPDADPSVSFEQSATTTEIGTPATAAGDDTNGIALGTYSIQETRPRGGASGGSWDLVLVECDGRPVPSSEGRIEVRLTAANPTIDCTFTNAFSRTPEPPVPPQPPGPDNPAVPETQVVITKKALRTTVRLGETIPYRITVANRGAATAENVIANEVLQKTGKIVALKVSQGRCQLAGGPICFLGNIAPGRTVTVTARVRPDRVGSYPNMVVVRTETVEPRLRDNAATARVRVRPARAAGPSFTG